MKPRNFKYVCFSIFAILAICINAVYADDSTLIEQLYSTTGPNSTKSTTSSGYLIYYPSNMTGVYPVIAWGNGTGAPSAVYSALFQHWASWGFIVIASPSTQAGTGQPIVDAIDFISSQNTNPSSPFFGKVDVNNIGVSGHSQGGGGAISAATDPRVKCSATLAPGMIFGVTPYDAPRRLNGPALLIAGSNDSIVPPALVRTTAYIPSNKVPTIFGIAQGMTHMSFLWSGGMAQGYATAWFMYYLRNDSNAHDAFEGRCEMCNNSNWTVAKKNY